MELSTLITFYLKIWYDPEILKVNSCSKSGVWADKRFEFNIDSVYGEILLVGIDGGMENSFFTSGAILEIAECEFTVIRAESVRNFFISEKCAPNFFFWNQRKILGGDDSINLYLQKNPKLFF